MIDLERFNRDIAEIEGFIDAEVDMIESPSDWSRRAGVSKQMLNAVKSGKNNFSLQKKIDIYKRLMDK